MTAPEKPTCFIAMPITTHQAEADTYGDSEHWLHVMETFFVKAVEDAGLEPVLPQAEGSDLIHARIIEQLVKADLVLVDLSSHNPNVFFELGVRTATNKPIALVADQITNLPFDTNGINTHRYNHSLKYWNILPEQARLADHIRASYEGSKKENPLWKKFGIDLVASTPASDENSFEAKIDTLMEMVRQSSAPRKTAQLDASLSEDLWHAALSSRDFAEEATSVGQSPARRFMSYARNTNGSKGAHLEAFGSNDVVMVWDSTPSLATVERVQQVAERLRVTLHLPQVAGQSLKEARLEAAEAADAATEARKAREMGGD